MQYILYEYINYNIFYSMHFFTFPLRICMKMYSVGNIVNFYVVSLYGVISLLSYNMIDQGSNCYCCLIGCPKICGFRVG